MWSTVDQQEKASNCWSMSVVLFSIMSKLNVRVYIFTLTVLSQEIVGGQNADEDEYPWQVWYTFFVSPNTFSCGGTLISRKHVLTAAHCTEDVVSVNDFTLYVREYNTNANGNEMEIAVAQNIVHPNYKQLTTEDNDFAILVLAQDLTFGPGVNCACLPKGKDKRVDTIHVLENCITVSLTQLAQLILMRELP